MIRSQFITTVDVFLVLMLFLLFIALGLFLNEFWFLKCPYKFKLEYTFKQG